MSKEFIDMLRPAAEAASRTTGIPAEFILGQAAHETAWGKSLPKKADGSTSFNLFGIKAGSNWKGESTNTMTHEFINGKRVDMPDKFRAYGSYEESMTDWANLIKRRFPAAIGATDGTSFGTALQQQGYATDPQYGPKMGAMVKSVQKFMGSSSGPTPPPASPVPVAAPQPEGLPKVEFPEQGVGAAPISKMRAAEDANKKTMLEGIANIPQAFALENRNSNWWLNRIDDEYLKPTQAEAGWQDNPIVARELANIPQANHAFLMDGTISTDHFVTKLDRYRQARKRQEELDTLGGWSKIGSFAASVAGDPTTLLYAVPGIGELAMVSKTSRIANAAATAAGWGASAAGFAATNKAPLQTAEDVVAAGAFGAFLGAGFGGLTNPVRRQMLREAGRDLEGRPTTTGPHDKEIEKAVGDQGVLRLGWNGKFDQINLPFEGWNGTRFSTREQWIEHLRGIDERIKNGSKPVDPVEPPKPDGSATGTGTVDPTTGVYGVHRDNHFGSAIEQYVGKILKGAHTLFENGAPLEKVREGFAQAFRYDANGVITGVNAAPVVKRLTGLTGKEMIELGGDVSILHRYGLRTKQDVEAAVGAYVSSRAGKAVQAEDELWAFRRGMAPMKASKVLDALISGHLGKLYDVHPSFQGLAKRIRSLGDRMNDVEIHLFDDANKLDVGGSSSPHYDFANNRIMMPMLHKDDASILLHEIAHAQTWHKIWQWSNNPGMYPEGGKLYKQLDELRKAVLPHWEKYLKSKGVHDLNPHQHGHSTTYYLTGFGKGDQYANNEFIAGLFSGDQQFLDFLNSIPYKGQQTILGKIWDVISKVVFGAKDGTALAELSKIVDRTMDVPMTVQTIDYMSGHTIPMMATNFQPQLGVPMAVAQAATNGSVPTVWGWGLGLENRLLGSKAAQAMHGVRELAAKIFQTTIGFADHSVVGHSAWDHANHLRNKWGSTIQDSEKKHFLEYAKSTPALKRAEAYEKFNTEVWEASRGMGQNHHPAVTAHAATIRKLLDNDIREAINNPSGLYGGTKRSLVSREVFDPVTGTKKIVGELEQNTSYFPRKNDAVKWNSVVATKGRDAVEKFYGDAFAAANPHISQQYAERFGKWYVKAFESARVNKDQDLISGLLQGRDLDAMRESLMTHGGFTAHDADTIIQGMKPVDTDKGAVTSNLKHRNFIDESYVDGVTGLSLKDFVDTNATRVMRGYVDRQAGAISAAHHLDIYKQGDWSAALAKATSPGLGTHLTEAQIEEMRTLLQFSYDRLIGVPVENPTKVGKVMEMFRNFNVIRLMGGAVFNQMSEMGQVLGSLGLGVVSRAIPEYSRLKAAIKAGAATDEAKFFKDLYDGVGATLTERMDFGASDDWVKLTGQNDTFTKSLDWLDNGLRKGASGLLKYTGMTKLTAIQRKVHATGMVNHIMDLARTQTVRTSAGGTVNVGKESALFSKERLAWMGMTEADFTALKSALLKHEKADKSTMWAKMQQDDPDLYAKLITAIHRESKRVVQENDLGSMVPIMGKGAAQTFFQFQNFAFQAWNKAMLHGMHQRDGVAFAQMAYTSMFGSLVYMARQQAQSMGMDETTRAEFMEKQFNPVKVSIGGGIFRTAQASLMPNIVGTVLPTDWLQGTKTTSDVTSIFSAPAVQTVKAVGSMIKDPMRAALDDEYQIAQRDVKQWSRLIPFNNFLGQSLIGNFLAKDFPSSNNE